MPVVCRPWAIVAVVAITLTAACKGDGVTGPVAPPTPAGTYTLNNIDAKVLPYTMYSDTGYMLQVQSGTMSITANGKWVAKTTTLETVVGNVSTYSDSTFGTWSVAAGSKLAVLINSETSVTSNATWTATDVTVNDVDGATVRKITYRRP